LKAEWDALIQNQTFHIDNNIIPATDKGPILSMLAFKIKTNVYGINKYNVRLVCCGFTQVEGFDYSKVYAPLIKLATCDRIG
jgi:hypothetical protein